MKTYPPKLKKFHDLRAYVPGQKLSLGRNYPCIGTLDCTKSPGWLRGFVRIDVWLYQSPSIYFLYNDGSRNKSIEMTVKRQGDGLFVANNSMVTLYYCTEALVDYELKKLTAEYNRLSQEVVNVQKQMFELDKIKEAQHVN